MCAPTLRIRTQAPSALLACLLALPACALAAPGRAGRPTDACFRAREGCKGLRPVDLHSVYSLPLDAPGPQTIAIIGIEDDPRIEHDLKVYDTEFPELPPCTHANGCFERLNGAGRPHPLPPVSPFDSHETAMDVEVAHAVCQNCRIVLLEAAADSLPAVEEAVETAAGPVGAEEISISWGGPEPAAVPREGAAFDHPGIVITASSGDTGYLNWDSEPAERGAPEYPASSPYVIAVGGTSLALGPKGERAQETLWPGSGSGCSTLFAAPLWQQRLEAWPSVGCGGQRAVADIAVDGDPSTGVAVYDSVEEEGAVPGWEPQGKTSLGAPLIAAAFALAGGAHDVAYPARTLYENEALRPDSLYDIAEGSNGECTKILGCTTEEEAAACRGAAICLARRGYDGPSGVGSLNGLSALIPYRAQSIDFTSEPPAPARAGGPPYTVAGAATSGLPVAFSSSTPSICDVSGDTVRFLAAGTCILDANQAGDEEWQPAPQASQAIAVAGGENAPGAGSGGVLTYDASAVSSTSVGLRLLAAPSVDRRTGAVSLSLRVPEAGELRWQLTFANGAFGVIAGRPMPCRTGLLRLRGGCRPALALYASGSKAGTPGTLRLTARPRREALLALRRALALGRGLRVGALVTFQPRGAGAESRAKGALTVELAHR